MQKDYLLESNGIQAKDLKKIYSDDLGRWIIELKAPKQGYCPVCKTRSRSRKTYGFHRIQGIGSQNLPVTIILPWVCFYCRDPHCPRSTFRIIKGRYYRGPGKLSWKVHKLIQSLWARFDQNNCQIVRFLLHHHAIKTSETTVRRISLNASTFLNRIYAPKHLGIDENYPKGIKRAKGRGRRPVRARLMLADLDSGTILAMTKGTKEESARDLLSWAAGRYDLSQVEDVTRDLNRSWDKVLREFLDQPGKPVVIKVDRFHLVRNLIKLIYSLYSAERTSLRERGFVQASKELFQNRYRFRKRRSRLELQDQLHHTNAVGKLDRMLSRHPQLEALYRLKEDIYSLIDLKPEMIDCFPDKINSIAETARNLGLGELADSLRRHQDTIKNALQAPPTHFLPEQCFVPFRAAERRRKSFRTDRSRRVYLLAQTYHAINPTLIRAHTE